MSKITLSNLASSIASSIISNTNANNAVIQTAFDNTLSRDGTSPNQMAAQLDMNSQRIINLPIPSTNTEPVRLDQFNTLSTSLSSTVATTLGYATAAGVSAAAAATSAANAATTLTTFKNIYYGAFAVDQTFNPQGGSPKAGDFYFNTVSNIFRIYNAGAWYNGVSSFGLLNNGNYGDITASGSGTTLTINSSFINRAALQSGSVNNGVNTVRVRGYTTEGIGAAWYNRVTFTNSPNAAQVNSNSNTVTWQVAEIIPTATQCGAVGDGVTDDTAAIQALLNLANFVRMPSGTFIVSTLTVPSNITITGNGLTSILKQKASTAQFNSILNLTSVSGVSIINLTIDGNGNNQPSGEHNHGIQIFDSSSVFIEDCTIHDCNGDGVSAASNTSSILTKNIIVTGCTFYNLGRHGFCAANYGASNIKISNNIAYVGTYVTTSTSKGNPIHLEIDTLGAINFIGSISIENNDCLDAGISLSGAWIDVSIVGNTVRNCKYAAQQASIFVVDVNSLSISSNTVYGDGSTAVSGILVNQSDATAVKKQYQVNIIGNAIRNVAGPGLNILAAGAASMIDVSITGNVIRDCTGAQGYPIWATNIFNLNVTGNTFNNCLAVTGGFRIDSVTQFTFDGNAVFDCGSIWGLVMEPANNALIQGNRIGWTTVLSKTAVYCISCSEVFITGNDFTFCTTVLAQSGSSGIITLGNVSPGTPDYVSSVATRTGAVVLSNTDIAGLGALAIQNNVSLTTQATGTLQAAQAPAFTGDATNTVGTLGLTISALAVTSAKMAVGAAVANIGYTPANKAGDTFTGNIVLSSSGSNFIGINRPLNTGQNNLYGFVAGNQRWSFILGNGTVEAGANSGSDFAIGAYNDGGTNISVPLTIIRATGAAVFSANVAAATFSTTGQITSTLATGTAPFVIASTTLVPNLYVARAASADTIAFANYGKIISYSMLRM